MSESNPAAIVEFLSRYGASDGVIAAHMILPGKRPPWRSTQLELRRGQAYSLFASGRIQWSKRHPHLYGGPRFHLWARVSPDGKAVNLSATTGTFVADVDGTLELGLYIGMWADEYGTLASGLDLYAPLEGSLDVAIAVFEGDPLKTLETIGNIASAPPPVTAEIQRLRQPYVPPARWHYLHEAGYSEMYHAEQSSGGPVIHAHAADDQGILRRDVDFPLTRETILRWRWRVDEHPSREPEDRVTSHDYVSVATEFDNGRDLTWIWSSSLQPGTHFHCPIKVWSARETHYVLRSADASLGRWYTEARNVYDDVAEAMGPPPTRITAVWLIALSTFHHRVARASFADITLSAGGSSVSML